MRAQSVWVLSAQRPRSSSRGQDFRPEMLLPPHRFQFPAPVPLQFCLQENSKVNSQTPTRENDIRNKE